MKPSTLFPILVLICLILSACAGKAPIPSNTRPTDTVPEIRINFADTKAEEILIDTVTQPNCDGTAEVENLVEKARSIEHVLEGTVGVSVNANGQVGFAGTDVELGATVAQQLGTTYGSTETITKSITLKAKPGTNMQHLIRLIEVWKVGTAVLEVGKEEMTVPFRFRNDFAIELVSSKDNGCTALAATSIFATATATQPMPSTTPSAFVTTVQTNPTSQPGTTQPDTGWQGEYFDNSKFQEPAAHTRTDTAPIFDWKESNPAPGIPIDYFSVRWTRCLTLQDRYYVFNARADDHVKVYVDDILVMETGSNNVERAFAVSAGQHCIKVELVESWGNASIYFDFQPGEGYQTADESTAWKGEYFDNDRFQEPAAYIRNDPAPIFDWKESNPAPGIPIDYFSTRWTRCLPFEDRYYVFTSRADDRVKVYVDDIMVLDAGSSNVERSFAISGGRHCIKLELVESWGAASVFFDFKPGEAYQSADASTAWKGEYFNNTNFQSPTVYTRLDTEPIFNWKDSNPAPGIPIDYYSVRWTRCMNFEGREYSFTARADDRVKVYVDDIMVLEAGSSNVERPFTVSAGQHCIKLEFIETWGNASVYFGFE